MQTVTSSDGTEIAYERRGEGPPLVLVHGTSGDHHGWDVVAPTFAESFAVYAVDRRGRGASGDADGYEIEREYADVAAVVERAAAEAPADAPTTLFGHSYGAICSLNAVLETDALDRLLLYEPPLGDAPAEQGFAEELDAVLDSEGPEAALVTFLRSAVGMSDPVIDAMREEPMWDHRVAAAPTIPREIRATHRSLFDPDAFADVDLPATLFVGGESREPMRAATDDVADALGDAEVVTFEGQGHIAMHTATDAFADAVFAALE